MCNGKNGQLHVTLGRSTRLGLPAINFKVEKCIEKAVLAYHMDKLSLRSCVFATCFPFAPAEVVTASCKM